jgi:hypothetical protein
MKKMNWMHLSDLLIKGRMYIVKEFGLICKKLFVHLSLPSLYTK